MENNAPFVITIGRQLGSSGRLIGQQLAKRLEIAYYDKVVLSQAAEDTGLGRNMFHHANERKGFLRQFIGAVQPFVSGGDFYSGHQLTEENLFTLQSGVIQRVTAERSCVIVGRAADYILRDHPRCAKIFITANMEDRVRRVMDQKKVDYKNAVKIINHVDNQRSSYYNFHTNNTWGNAEAYDLCVNISSLGADATLDLVTDFVCKKLRIELPDASTPSIPEVF